MIDDQQREQAALYALDALPADEAAKFRELVRENPDLAILVAEYEAAGSLLAGTAPSATPPPALRGRIMDAISTRTTPVEASRTSGTIWIPWGIAAALALATGTLWMQNNQLTERNSTLGGKAAALVSLEQEFRTLRTAAADKDRLAATLQSRIVELQKRNVLADTQIATLTSKLDGSYLASIAWDNTAQEGILKVRRLPAAEQDKEYQLWVIDPNSAAPISGGVFTVAADGSATIRFAPAQKVSSATAFAVSMEKSGGSVSPEGPIVLSN